MIHLCKFIILKCSIQKTKQFKILTASLGRSKSYKYAKCSVTHHINGNQLKPLHPYERKCE